MRKLLTTVLVASVIASCAGQTDVRVAATDEAIDTITTRGPSATDPPTTSSAPTTTVAETVPPTTVTAECVNGATENRNVTDTGFDQWRCIGGKWTFQIAKVLVKALSVEEVDGALSPAAAAWMVAPSPETFAALAAAAQSLVDAKRPFPLATNGAILLSADVEKAVRTLTTYPGNDVPVYLTLDTLRPIAPSLPPSPLLFDGSYTVGVDVAPGRYKTIGPVDGCYWETLDEAGEINDNNFVDAAPQVIMTVRKSDFAVNSEDCGPWRSI